MHAKFQNDILQFIFFNHEKFVVLMHPFWQYGIRGIGLPKHHDNFFPNLLICMMADVISVFHGEESFLNLRYNSTRIILILRIKSAI